MSFVKYLFCLLCISSSLVAGDFNKGSGINNQSILSKLSAFTSNFGLSFSSILPISFGCYAGYFLLKKVAPNDREYEQAKKCCDQKLDAMTSGLEELNKRLDLITNKFNKYDN